MTIQIHSELSHLDHHLTTAQLAYVLAWFHDRTGFFAETVRLPDHHGTVPCGLYGPVMGDAPVEENDVSYRVRPGRVCASRMVARPLRPTRDVTAIAGPYQDFPCVLFTAFGGPLAPREPGDHSITTWEELLASRAFWREHALAVK